MSRPTKKEKQKKEVKKIIDVLSGQRFYNFYAVEGGPFDTYLANRVGKKELAKEIEEKIIELFEL